MAKTPSVQFLTPVGRIVYGDPWEPNTTDANGNPLAYAPGHPKFGQPKIEYLLNLAIDKRDPEFAVFYAAIDKLARESWQQFYQGPPGPDGRPTCTNPNMSLKIMDGDGFDGNGKPNSTKEGYAGCWIVKLKSAFKPKVYYKDHYAEHEQITDPKLVVCGDFVRVGGSMSSNLNVQKPGLYMNVNQIALWGKGTPITSGPAASTVFGAAGGGFTPAGMSALPAPPVSGGGMPTMAGIGMPMQSPAGMTPAGMPPGGPLAGMPMAQPAQTMPGVMAGSALPAAMPGMAATYVQPNPAILGGPVQPAAGGMPAMPGMPGLPALQPLQPLQPAAPTLTPAAVQAGYTWAALEASGQSVDQLRAAGYIV